MSSFVASHMYKGWLVIDLPIDSAVDEHLRDQFDLQGSEGRWCEKFAQIGIAAEEYRIVTRSNAHSVHCSGPDMAQAVSGLESK